MTHQVLPEFVEDKLGNEVRPGDRIAYALREGDQASIATGTVLNFQFAKKAYYGEAKALKVKVLREPEIRYVGGPTKHYQPSVIDPMLKRFVKLGETA